MIECEICKEWYHLDCIRIPKPLRIPKNENNSLFYCGFDSCNNGKRVFKIHDITIWNSNSEESTNGSEDNDENTRAEVISKYLPNEPSLNSSYYSDMCEELLEIRENFREQSSYDEVPECKDSSEQTFRTDVPAIKGNWCNRCKSYKTASEKCCSRNQQSYKSNKSARTFGRKESESNMKSNVPELRSRREADFPTSSSTDDIDCNSSSTDELYQEHSTERTTTKMPLGKEFLRTIFKHFPIN